MARKLHKDDFLPIGELASRTGLSVSAIRFYEDKGLVQAMRTGGNQRRFLRSDIRRLSFILIAQQLGLALSEIEQALARLPQGRTPNARDWRAISVSIREQLDRKIAQLEATRNKLDGCIGCGCLSMKNCPIYNEDDKLAAEGSGPVILERATF